MSMDVQVPHGGLAMDEYTIVEWLCEIGDTVDEGQPLVEMETDKADTELPSPAAGTVTEILAQPGDEVEPGQVIARLDPV